MGLLGEVQAAKVHSRPGLPCVVIRLRTELTGDDLKDFEALLADDSVYATTLTRVLNDRGLDVPRGSLQRHRRGECGCSRR